MKELHTDYDNPEQKPAREISDQEQDKPSEDDRKKLSTDDIRKNLYDEEASKERWKKEADDFRNRAHEDPRYTSASEAEREGYDRNIENRAQWIENGRRGNYEGERKKHTENGDSGENDNMDSRARLRDDREYDR